MSKAQTIQHFRSSFDSSPELIVRAPGRINLIGEHTDYNEGFVVPGAIDKSVWVAVAPRTDHEIHLYAWNYKSYYKTDLQSLQRSDKMSWPHYVLGIMDELMKISLKPSGVNVCFGGDIPAGAGLSSSAAVESGMLFALNELCQFGLSRTQMARLARQAENNFVGMQCGIMDMFASLHGRENHVLRLDCRDLSYTMLPFQFPGYLLFVCDSGVKHALVHSEYNTRRLECETGVEQLRRHYPDVRTLRDVNFSMLSAVASEMDPVIWRRCKYVAEELERVDAAGKAMTQGDVETLGSLLTATHAGLRDDYEVSCTETDHLVAVANGYDFVAGSRMMGGGFGGCTVHLIREGSAADFQKKITKSYFEQFGRYLRTFPVNLGNGAERVE